MCADRLRADLQRIAQVSGQVRAITAEFESETEMVSGYSGYTGSAQLTGALDSFASGWAKHRAQLISDLQDTASKAELAVKEYRGTDDQLADALRKDSTPKKTT
jgi:hypothetical protein